MIKRFANLLLVALLITSLLPIDIAYAVSGFDPDNGDLTNGLINYYNLDDVTDAVGSVDLTNNNSATFSIGKIGNALTDGSDTNNRYLSANTSLVNPGNTNNSMSFWFQVDKDPDNGQQVSLINLQDTTSDVVMTIIYIQSGGTIGYRFRRNKFGGTFTEINHTETMSLDTWHHIVFVYDGTDIRAYVNNVATVTVGSNDGTGSIDIADRFSIGPDGDGEGVSNSDIVLGMDETGIWNRALSVSEIADLYNSGNGNAYRPLPHGIVIDSGNVIIDNAELEI